MQPAVSRCGFEAAAVRDRLYCASACVHLRKRLCSDRMLYYPPRGEWLVLCWIRPDVRIAFHGLFCWRCRAQCALIQIEWKVAAVPIQPPPPSSAPGLLSNTDPAPFLTRGAVLGMVISALRAAQRPFVCIDRCSASQPISQAGIIIYSCRLNSTARKCSWPVCNFSKTYVKKKVLLKKST